jgi:2-oxoglutarate dehydrogenase E2 component (dihydrolipoamide succinyltransferase)
MAEQVVLPSMGFAILDAKLISWLKKKGDPVQKEEPIASVETDKLSFEVTSPIDGVLLDQLYNEGDIVPVDNVMAVVGQAAEAALSTQAVVSQPAPLAAATIAPPIALAPTPAAKPLATPAAKALAKERGVSLAAAIPTAPGGVVAKRDVAALAAQAGAVAVAAAAPAAPTPAAPVAATATEQRLPFAGIRKTIADNLMHSVQNTVHVTTSVEVDMTEAWRLRGVLKDDLQKTDGIKLSFVPFFIKAAAAGIAEFPILNSSLEGDEIVIKSAVNFSIAVDTPKGLMVPVIKNTQALSFRDLAKNLESMLTRTKNGQIKPEDIGGGTISLSNAGAFGAVHSTPIIAYPQSAVVWTGAILEKPAVIENQIVPRRLMTLCVSYDHRIMDGAKVASFLGVMKRALESPWMLIMS